MSKSNQRPGAARRTSKALSEGIARDAQVILARQAISRHLEDLRAFKGTPVHTLAEKAIEEVQEEALLAISFMHAASTSDWLML